MRRQAMKFDREAWRKCLLQTGDYERYQLAVAKALADQPHEYYVAQVDQLKSMVSGMAGLIRSVPQVRLLWILKTSNAYTSLALAAQRKDWRTYIAIRKANETVVIHEMEAMRRILLKPRTPGGEWHKQVEFVLADLDEGLSLYQSGIRYYDSLASVATGSRQGGGFDQAEARVTSICGKDSALGNEYRHIRNAFGHKTVRVIVTKHIVRFRDKNPTSGKVWTRDYTTQGLLRLYLRLSDWVVAKGLAAAFEGIVTNSILAKETETSEP